MGRRKHDIERYLRGEMTPREMHALEKEALQDPFLSEALEGANQIGPDSFLFDLKELHNTLHQRTQARRPKVISLWRWSLGIAAGLILLAVASVYIIGNLSNHRPDQTLAVNKEVAPQTAADTTVEVKHDTIASRPAAGQAIALNKPAQPAQAKKKSSGQSRPQVPTSNPVAGAASRDEETASQVERVAQTEAIETEDQRIVEADLAEAPREIERADDNAGAADKKRAQASRASEARREVAANPRTIQGKVISTEDGMPLPGVNVMVKGTNIGTITDEVGHYQIALNDPKQTLVFQFIGLKEVEVRAENNREINIQMTPDYTELSEVVVTGAGTTNNNVLQFAEPQGGRNAFEKYLEEKMNYPELALENKVEGRVTVQFTVDANGQLGEFKVIKGIGYGCDDEVIRLIKEGPAWNPSKRNDRPVKDKVKVRLKFDLPD
ncbi:TonB family protein [Fulvivirgaceae bacterium PWU4]|uniref:TonB family protein n=1 Tax=Chryseosolibacter histidini TaxID=2782349 RepID=A0AAP2DQP7_9BACT|nr:TonB family protein [Chryseosolibacter histidini]MBT1699583.1 TonB family protein [Chryseosolibacter histidini]